MEMALLCAGAALYTASAVWALVRLRRPGGAGSPGPEAVLAAALAVLVGFMVARGARTGSFPVTDAAESRGFFAAAGGAGPLAFAADPGSRALGAFLLPVGSALSIASLVAASLARPHSREFDGVFLALHAISWFAGYAAFAFGGASGVAYLIQERALRRKKLGGLSRRLPSLSVLDRLNYRAVTLGSPLLTFGMVTGSVWSARATLQEAVDPFQVVLVMQM